MQIESIPESYQAAPTALQGKTILVTGAGDGIGRAAAMSYAAHGATVVLLGRTEAKLEAVYDDIEQAGGPKPALVPMDLAAITEEQAANLAGHLEAEFGFLDGLLHNASLLGERRSIASSTWHSWREVMQVNVNAAFLLTRELLPLLQAAPAASVVFTSSGVGRVGKAFWGVYAASKFATEGIMQVLAAELENTSQVRVNCINPGATNTAMRRAAYPAETPTDNPSPGEIMETYLYLISDDSAGVTGISFNAQQAR